MKFLKLGAAVTVLGCAAGLISPAAADQVSVNFNFNDMNTYNTAPSKPAGTSGQNVSSGVIAAYMQAVLRSAFAASSSAQIQAYKNTATVATTGDIGQQGASSYVGEGFVVGPTIGTTGNGQTTPVYDLTLANTEGSKSPNTTTSAWRDSSGGGAGTGTSSGKATDPPQQGNSNPDGFIKNCTSATDPAYSSSTGLGCNPADSPDMFMNFLNIVGLKIISISFDFEIFPNGNCAADTSAACGAYNSTTGHYANYPDMSVWTGDNGGGTQLAEYWAIDPGASSTYSYSSNSYAAGGKETAPQRLDTGIVTTTLSGKSLTNLTLTSLDFMDWPNTIGIDNLSITFAPEPGSFAIFGFGLLGLGALMRRRRGSQTAVSGSVAV